MALLCSALAPGAADAGPRLGVGLSAGVSWPHYKDALMTGGVWRASLDYQRDEKLSLSLELGATWNDTAGRVVYVDGGWYDSRLHGVSTLILVGRYVPQPGRFSPYLTLGPSFYFSWDDIQPTPNAYGTTGQHGFAILMGVGATYRLWPRLDLYTEGDYHYATDSEDDARFHMIQAGLRFWFGATPEDATPRID